MIFKSSIARQINNCISGIGYIGKINSIKRATSVESQEDSKKKIKALRTEIYNRLDNGKKNAFTDQGENADRKNLIKGSDNDRTQKR